MNPEPDVELLLSLAPEEAEEIMSLSEAILKDNAPDGAQFLRGEGLVNRVLLYNDPENYQRRNRDRFQAVEEVLHMESSSPPRAVGTYHEAEIEYEYLLRVSSIYLKIFRQSGE